MDSIKVFLLGLLIFFFPKGFYFLYQTWFSEREQIEDLKTRVGILRGRFWKAFFWIFIVMGITLSALFYLEFIVNIWSLIVRATAVFIALMGALGRGGYKIQTWKGETIIERIDRGMYVLSQLGAAAIVLLAFSL